MAKISLQVKFDVIDEEEVEVGKEQLVNDNLIFKFVRDQRHIIFSAGSFPT